MVWCQNAQSLKACLSVQTVNMCSKYLDVISRKSESLKPVIIETSLARRPVSYFKTMTPLPAQHAGEEENILIRGHDGDLSWTIQSWLPLYAGGLTLSDLGSTSPRNTNGLDDKLKLESGFAHVISCISKAVKFGKKMESWGIDHSGALLTN